MRERVPPLDRLLVQVSVVDDSAGCVLAVRVALSREEEGRRGGGCGGTDEAALEKIVYELRFQAAFVRT